jgi:predicted dehydrogenase
MKQSLNWGVIGTGGIASDFTQALGKSSRGTVVNVVGSAPAKGRAFKERWGIARSSDTLADLLKDSDVEAVYVATPHPAHEQQAIACIAAGKHVLCEKPLCVDAEKTQRVISAAESNKVLLLEAYMYRCHPLMREVVERLKSGVIGTIRHLRADFGFRVERAADHRLYAPLLGGGGILDVGGYPVSLARLLAGITIDKPFSEPTDFSANGYIGPHGADELACALLTFESGFTAQLTCAVFHQVGTQAVIYADQGKIILPDPWIPEGDRQSTTTSFVVHKYGAQPEKVEVRTEKATYALEAELVADTLPGLDVPWPAMSHADTLGNMRVLDAWRAKLG